ncbi:RNA polymerase sigma factor [Aquirufa aurantiipilula]
MNHTIQSDQELVAKLQTGQKSAFEEIYKKYWRKLYNIAFHQTGKKEEAEELVQDLFVGIWQRRETAQIKHLDLYLTLSIKNKIYDFIKSQISYRKYQEYIILKEVDLHFETDSIVNYLELTAAVEKVLSLLPEKSAQAFRMSRFEDLPVKKIAEEMELSEKAVEYHITKSLRFIKENLKTYYSAN